MKKYSKLVLTIQTICLSHIIYGFLNNVWNPFEDSQHQITKKG